MSSEDANPDAGAAPPALHAGVEAHLIVTQPPEGWQPLLAQLAGEALAAGRQLYLLTTKHAWSSGLRAALDAFVATGPGLIVVFLDTQPRAGRDDPRDVQVLRLGGRLLQFCRRQPLARLWLWRDAAAALYLVQALHTGSLGGALSLGVITDAAPPTLRFDPRLELPSGPRVWDAAVAAQAQQQVLQACAHLYAPALYLRSYRERYPQAQVCPSRVALRASDQGCSAPKRAPAAPTLREHPLVSVCIAHRNQGAFLAEAVESLLRQDYPNLEFLVVDDRSTEEKSLVHWVEVMRRLDKDPRWSFVLENQRGGPGATRNVAARQARGALLLFFDADNLARPSMVRRLVEARQRGGADVWTCWHARFRNAADLRLPDAERTVDKPLGAFRELAPYQNLLGDATMLVQRTAFEAVGGFTADADLSFEDYECLLQLTLKGYRLQPVPEVLYDYRWMPRSFSRRTSEADNRSRALRPWFESLTPAERERFWSLLYPRFCELRRARRRAGRRRLWRALRNPDLLLELPYTST